MNRDDFKQPTGKLLRAAQGEASYRAFVPNSLPPQSALILFQEKVSICGTD